MTILSQNLELKTAFQKAIYLSEFRDHSLSNLFSFDYIGKAFESFQKNGKLTTQELKDYYWGLATLYSNAAESSEGRDIVRFKRKEINARKKLQEIANRQ